MYFTRFPKGQYIIPGTKEYKLVTDLWRRIKIRDKIKDEASLYSEYFVADGERPETIAERHFGSPELHWIILITNNVTDGLHGWPLSFSAFEEYVNDKYENPGAIHHYENVNKEYVDIDPYNTPSASLTPITNFERYIAENDLLKQINVIKPSLVEQISLEFKKVLSN